jgi:hypothetical protein
MQKFLLILLLFFIQTNEVVSSTPFTRSNIEKLERKEYKVRLEKVITAILNGKTVEVKEIEYIIPSSQNEFSDFYSFDSQETSSTFHKLNELVREYATQRKLNVFTAYVKFAEFVDGEFAEGYFDSLEKVIRKNKKAFCKIQHTLNSKVKARIAENCSIKC